MPGGERKKQANGGWGALNKFQSPFLLAFEVESELLPFKFQSPPSSRSVTEGFEKKVESGAKHECDGSGLNEQHAWAFDAAAGETCTPSLQCLQQAEKALKIRGSAMLAKQTQRLSAGEELEVRGNELSSPHRPPDRERGRKRRRAGERMLCEQTRTRGLHCPSPDPNEKTNGSYQLTPPPSDFQEEEAEKLAKILRHGWFFGLCLPIVATLFTLKA
ncbi:hypothetical protein PAMP_011031 [Pampus punctatissimus]